MSKETNTHRDPGKELKAWTERDLTQAAREGELPRAHGREALLGRIQQILATGKSAVLTGEPGVGKSALVYELVRRWSAGDGPGSLSHRRVLQISLRRRASALTKPEQLGSRLAALVEELRARTDPFLLFVRDFHHLWTFDLEPQFETLLYRLDGPLICEGERGLVGSIFDHYPELERHYVVVPVEEPSLAETRRILERWADEEADREDPGDGEAEDGAGFEPEALDMALQLSHRFLARGRLPRKALEPLKQLAALRRPGERIRASHVIERFCDSYALPRFLVDPEVPLEPEDLERELSSRLLGQPEAVSAVIDLIFLIKAGLSDPRRPFGVFLFVGPTGVGKTLLAQLLAERLFGARDRLIRLNMADYPKETDPLTLFGNPDAHRLVAQRGVLTQRIFGHPFAVLLLDEFEKCASTVHDRFLQLFDEGQFINGAGETVSCRSLILIATSNVGAELWRGGRLGFAGNPDVERIRREVDLELRRVFRFEFLNRFDRIVHFQPLNRQAIRTIAARELEQLGERAGLSQRGLDLELDDGLLDWLTVHGYDPHFGARFLRRTIERQVTTALADLVVRESPPAGSRLTLEVRGRKVVARRVDARVEDEARRAPVTLPEGTSDRLRSLSGDEIRREAEAVLTAAEESLEALRARQAEYRELLARINAEGFWDGSEDNRRVLERFRELDVAIQVERRLAEPLETLAEQSRSWDPEPADLESAARALEIAAGALAEWQERSAEQGESALWLLISAADPLRPPSAWIESLAAMEIAWCRHLGLTAAVVGYSPLEDPTARVALEVEGPGAAVYLAMEAGTHRRSRSRGRDERALIEVLLRGPAPAKSPVRGCRTRPGRFDLDVACSGRVVFEHTGQVLDFAGQDPQALGHFLSDLAAHRGEEPVEAQPIARVYNEGGTGARDPRTGAHLPRLKDALRGRLDPLLEAWRRGGQELERGVG